LEEKKQLQLLFGEPSDRRHQPRHVLIDLLFHDRCRMTLARFEIVAVLRALDFDQALGGAADRADVAAERGAATLGGPLVTERASRHMQTVSGYGRVNSRRTSGARKCVDGRAGV